MLSGCFAMIGVKFKRFLVDQCLCSGALGSVIRSCVSPGAMRADVGLVEGVSIVCIGPASSHPFLCLSSWAFAWN